MTCIQPPPSIEEAILVWGCKVVEAQIGTSTRLQLVLLHDRRADCYLGRLVHWPLDVADSLKVKFGFCHRAVGLGMEGISEVIQSALVWRGG